VQTLKTAIVVVLLLVVFYGVYEMLNRPPAEAPPAVATLPPDATAELDIDLGEMTIEAPSVSAPAPPEGVAPGGSSDEMSVSISEPPSASSYYGSSAGPAGADPANASFPPVPGGSFEPPGDASADPVSPKPAAQPAEASASPSSRVTTADSSVFAIPGNPQLQHNPYVNQEPVPKPVVAGSGQQQIGARAYQGAVSAAQTLISEGNYRNALEKLSVFYKSQDLTEQQHRELLDLLDPLAGQVIYSREHLLEEPYVVGRSETLMEIAQQYQVPYQLLQKINGIENPQVLLPGSELKIVPGPFRAEVDLEAQELTLFLDRLYAGRFPITLGADPAPKEGDFQVREKQPGKTYFSMDGRTVPAESPANPFGGIWLHLGREVCIHGTPHDGVQQQHGCISLSPRDADDVYSILSLGSKVRILR